MKSNLNNFYFLSKCKQITLHDESLFSFLPCQYYSLEGIIQEPSILNDFQPWKGQYQFKKKTYSHLHMYKICIIFNTDHVSKHTNIPSRIFTWSMKLYNWQPERIFCKSSYDLNFSPSHF